jgi:glycosyltransferase involved in cell wall biosynthesis
VTSGPGPQFSIVTPVYDRPDVIGHCIESVLRQNDPGTEHIVVDDGSSELTGNAIRVWLSRPSVRCVDLKENRGVNFARNRGIEVARGDFVLFLDSDDVLLDQALGTIRRAILDHPGYLHYLFVPSDREHALATHPWLGNDVVEIAYEDWLRGQISGDFIHIMERRYLARQPFAEEFRVHEGITFLRLFRVSRKQLFVRQTVAQRERGRRDSVSDEYWLTSAARIETECRRIRLLLSEFRDDMARVNPAGLKALDVKRRWLETALKNHLAGRVLRAAVIARSQARWWLARHRAPATA